MITSRLNLNMNHGGSVLWCCAGNSDSVKQKLSSSLVEKC